MRFFDYYFFCLILACLRCVISHPVLQEVLVAGIRDAENIAGHAVSSGSAAAGRALNFADSSALSLERSLSESALHVSQERVPLSSVKSWGNRDQSALAESLIGNGRGIEGLKLKETTLKTENALVDRLAVTEQLVGKENSIEKLALRKTTSKPKNVFASDLEKGIISADVARAVERAGSQGVVVDAHVLQRVMAEESNEYIYRIGKRNPANTWGPVRAKDFIADDSVKTLEGIVPVPEIEGMGFSVNRSPAGAKELSGSKDVVLYRARREDIIRSKQFKIFDDTLANMPANPTHSSLTHINPMSAEELREALRLPARGSGHFNDGWEPVQLKSKQGIWEDIPNPEKFVNDELLKLQPKAKPPKIQAAKTKTQAPPPPGIQR